MDRTQRVLALAITSLLASCAGVPQALQPPAGERQLMTLQAAGQWIYHCRLSNDGQKMGWATLRPDAVLRDAAGQPVGRIEGGPNLVHRDGSVIELTARERSDVAGALPWTLYAARSAGQAGALTAVTSVQQLRTTGGALPGEGCSSGEQLMAERAIPFTAELRLYGR